MTKRFWNERRGAAAWMVAAAMVPLLGMVSLGSEVGSWYVIRRHAQNAADAAAIAGATALMNNRAGGPVADVGLAGQAFAASNGFGDGTAGTCGKTTGQSVCITPADPQVKAVVAQYETPIFTQWFLPKDKLIEVQATAVAAIKQKPGYCALGLQSIDFSGSTSLAGPCGLMSNGTIDPPPPGQTGKIFADKGWTVGAHTGCDPNGNGKINNTDPKCNLGSNVTTNYSAPTVPLPPNLVTLMKTPANGGPVPIEVAKPNIPAGTTPSPSSTNWQGAYTVNGTQTLAPGVYMFNALVVNGTLTGDGVHIIIGSGGLDGKGTISLTAGIDSGNALENAMDGVLIYDQQVTSAKFTGNFATNFNGAVYAPNASLTFLGGVGLKGCMIVVAKALILGGNSSLDMSGCSTDFLASIASPADVVMLID